MTPPIPRLALADGDANRAAIQHSGELTWREFPSLVDRVKRLLAAEGVAPARRHRVFSTFVEMAYNVLHHGQRAEPREGEPWRRVPAHVALGHEAAGVWIATANLVGTLEAAALERRLRALRAMSAEELRVEYRDELARAVQRAGDTPGAGGGLGLLTIARDAARPLEFEFVPAAERDGAMFRLKVVI